MYSLAIEKTGGDHIYIYIYILKTQDPSQTVFEEWIQQSTA
jgi:hypothetical protein